MKLTALSCCSLLCASLIAACSPAAPPAEAPPVSAAAPASVAPASSAPASSAPAASAAPATSAPAAPAGLAGRWTSDRFEGEGCATFIKQINIELTAAGTFSMTATLDQGGGERTDKRDGTWSAEGELLTLQSPGAPALKAAFKVEGETLRIEEVGARCVEHYKRTP